MVCSTACLANEGCQTVAYDLGDGKCRTGSIGTIKTAEPGEGEAETLRVLSKLQIPDRGEM